MGNKVGEGSLQRLQLFMILELAHVGHCNVSVRVCGQHCQSSLKNHLAGSFAYNHRREQIAFDLSKGKL